MNESEAVIIDQNTDVAEESCPTSQEAAEAAVQDLAETDPAPDPDGSGDEAPTDEAVVEEAGISDDPPADPDPDPDTASDPAEANGLDELRGELKRLREELAARDAVHQRAEREYADFSALYPDTPLSEIPDSVWQNVEQGVPLAAAYALAERRRQVLRMKAEESNRENLLRSSGKHAPTPTYYFSPDEVRSMSQSEVRANFSAILESMKTWK